MDTTAALVGVAPALPMARRVPLLVARGLVRRFEHGRGVGPVDLTLERGQFVALTGPSGAGKTTLLRLLAGLDAPTAGSLHLDAGERHVRRGDTRIALVFQQPRLSGRVSVLHNVLGGRLGHLPRWRGLLQRYPEADLRLALQALADVDLLSQADERTDRLSGGEQQRVAIARALAQQPRVLLADEPVASLDPDNANRVMQALRRCRERGLAVMASLHQPQLAAMYADRIMRLAGGRRVD